MDMMQFATMVLVLNLSCGIVNEMNVLGSTAPNLIGDQINDNLIIQVLTGTTTINVLSSIFQADQYMFSAIQLFILFFQMTMTLPLIFASAPFNFPMVIVAPAVLIQTLVYGIGCAYFLRGLSEVFSR